MTVEHAATLLFSMLIYDVSLMNEFLDYDGLKEWIFSALVQCECSEVRKILAKKVLQFCHECLRGYVLLTLMPFVLFCFVFFPSSSHPKSTFGKRRESMLLFNSFFLALLRSKDFEQIPRSTLDFFLRKLLSFLPDLEENAFTSKEYFGLLGQLLRFV